MLFACWNLLWQFVLERTQPPTGATQQVMCSAEYIIDTSPASISAAELLFLAGEVKDTQRESIQTQRRENPQSQEKSRQEDQKSALF